MRKLATIRTISAIADIPGADKIETAYIDGWTVVVEKGKHYPGEKIVFVEIDAWIPHGLAPFLSKGKEPREYQGIKGERLRSVKLRGQLSQGLVLPLQTMPSKSATAVGCAPVFSMNDGDDVSDFFGIVKWEREIPAQLRGQAKGNFPSFLRKTDQERVQNLVREIERIRESGEPEMFEVSIKLDGTSFTAYHNDGATGFCSRNLELKPEDEGSVYAQVFSKYHLADALAATGMNVAIQGEIMGPGIQGNREGLTEPTLYVFDVFDIDARQYMNPGERMNFFSMFLQHLGVQHVPLLCFIDSLPAVTDILRMADGNSINNPVREGIVFKSCDRDFSFKAISDTFLLKGGD